MGNLISGKPLRNHKWFRWSAFILAGALVWTAVMTSISYVYADLSDFTDDTDAAAGSHLLDNNDYMTRSWLQRAGIVTVAALSEPRSFYDYYQLVEISISRSDYKMAHNQIKACLDMADTVSADVQADIWLVKGSLETLLDEKQTALVSLAESIRLNPTLGNAYLVQSQIYIEREQWRSAVDTLALYFDCSSSIDPLVYAAMGDLKMILGDYPSAAVQYTSSMLKHDAADPDLYFRRGACFAQMGAYEAAIDDFVKAAELGADAKLCTENIVLCQLVIQDYDAVLRDGAVLAAETQASAEFLQNMGIAALALDLLDEAEKYFDRSITLNDELVAGYYYRGISRLSLEQYEEASIDFSMSIRRGEILQLSYYNRGVCYLNIEQYEKAQTDMNQTILTGGDLFIEESARAVLKQFTNP